MKRSTALIGVACAGLLLSGCRSPRYVRYTSPYLDFSCEVPWGWSVFLDSAGSDYTNVTFTGPMDPNFFRGVPSLSVRWYAHNAPHLLGNGETELYSSADDFMTQLLRDVYGPGSLEAPAYTKAGSDSDQAKAESKNLALPDVERISVSGWAASYFVVYRTLAMPEGATMGVVRDGAGKPIVRQRHGYVVLPMEGGFYVLVYPATRDGFDKHRPAFFRLINTFKALKDGPAGRSVDVPARPS